MAGTLLIIDVLNLLPQLAHSAAGGVGFGAGENLSYVVIFLRLSSMLVQTQVLPLEADSSELFSNFYDSSWRWETLYAIYHLPLIATCYADIVYLYHHFIYTDRDSQP